MCISSKLFSPSLKMCDIQVIQHSFNHSCTVDLNLPTSLRVSDTHCVLFLHRGGEYSEILYPIYQYAKQKFRYPKLGNQYSEFSVNRTDVQYVQVVAVILLDIEIKQKS